MRFTPLVDFHSDEFHSDYLVGLSYQARPEDEKLLGLLPTWIKEGKVREGLPSDPAGRSSVKGVGVVTDAQTITAADVGSADTVLKGGK